MNFMICALVGSSSLYASYDSDRIAQKLSNAGPRAFGSFRMFDAAINPQGLSEWNAVIKEGTELVRLANKNSSTAANYIGRINEANNNLLEGIKNVYDNMFLPYVGQNQLSREEVGYNINYQAQFRGIFSAIKNDMASLIKEVSKTKFLQSSIAEKEIIIELASAISNYADNAIASIDYKLSAEKKFSIKRGYVK